MNAFRRSMLCVVILALALVLATQTFARQEAPPEQKDIVAAMRIEDLNARIKELERIKAVFPNSSLMSNIDGMILTARIGLCATVDAVADLQRPVIAQAQGWLYKVSLYYSSSMQYLKIDRTNLAFVFFAQDKETKNVLNAFASDVK